MSTRVAEEARRRRYGRDTPEFARVAGLSDGVFAIAMTLLVLGLDVPDVAAADLADALRDRLPQVLAFALSFLLVANVWWEHHKFFSRLGAVEPGLIALNLALLGCVALVPFPTSLIGNAPTVGAAVVPFIGLFIVLSLLSVLLVVRARAVGALRWYLRDDLYRWVLVGWFASIAVMTLALVVAMWLPLAGLAVAGLSGTTVGVSMGLLAPKAYEEWA
jgi:uncharacterized membrane protein